MAVLNPLISWLMSHWGAISAPTAIVVTYLAFRSNARAKLFDERRRVLAGIVTFISENISIANRPAESSISPEAIMEFDRQIDAPKVVYRRDLIDRLLGRTDVLKYMKCLREKARAMDFTRSQIAQFNYLPSSPEVLKEKAKRNAFYDEFLSEKDVAEKKLGKYLGVGGYF